MSGFDTYRKQSKTGRFGRCVLCGEKNEGRVAVTLMARTEDPTRTTADANRVRYPAVDSMSLGFCETHAVEVYETVKAVLVEKGRR